MQPVLAEEVKTEETPKKKTGWRGPPGSINKAGRPKRDPDDVIDKAFTNRELKNRELLMLLRKLKPHVADAVLASVQVMQKGDSDSNRLRAADLILRNFHKLVLDMYAGQDDNPDDAGEEVQKKSAPIFSLRMLPSEEGDSKEDAGDNSEE